MEATRKPPRSPEDRFARSGPAAHRTFYREGNVSITDRWLTMDDRRFPIRELRNLRIVRDSVGGLSVASAAAGACVLAIVAVAVVAVADQSALIIGVPMMAVLPVGAAVAAWRRRRRYSAIYADYGDHAVQVFGSSDERRFNQVCRALVRATEFNREHPY